MSEDEPEPKPEPKPEPEPGLPDSDDPFVLLGVPHDADTKTLKRAHARLIRRYRPDRDPESFKRVQAAFEQAKRWAKLHIRLADVAPPEPEPPVASEAESEAPAPEATKKLADEPAPPKLWPLRPPASRAIGRADWIAEGIRKGAFFDLGELQDLPRQTFVQLAQNPQLRWRVLAKLPQREFALELHRERLEQLLAEDESAKALNEVDALLSDIVHEPALEAQVWRVAAHAAWRYYPEAERLTGSLAGGLDLPYEQEQLATAYEDIRRVARTWSLIRRRPVPTAFVRFVELSRVVTGPLARELKSALSLELVTEPDRYVDVVSRMATQGPELGPNPEQALAFVWESFALESPYGVPSYALLDAGERDELDGVLMRIEQEVRPTKLAGRGGHLLRFAAYAMSLAVGVLVRPLLGAVLFASFRYHFTENGDGAVNAVQTRKKAHRALMLAASHGELPPGCAAEHVHRHSERFRYLGSVVSYLRDDPAIDAMSVIGWTATHWDEGE